MASASAKWLSFLFLASLLFSQQAQARESQFFSKFTNFNNNNNEKETVTPVNKKQEEEPAFVPQTQGGYGLYGHEAGQFPPATTTNGAPHTITATTNNGAPSTTTATATTTSGAPYTTATTNNGAPYTTTTSTNNNNNNLPYTLEAIEKEEQHTDKYPETYHTRYNPNKDNFYYNGNNPSGISGTKLGAQSTFTTTTPTNSYRNNNNYYNNVERQGMSDTRYLENGKYYYDPRTENNYNNNQNEYGNYREVANDPKNWYNNRGNNGNNNNVNHHNNYNSMEGYQNEEEFQETDDQFVP